MGWVIVWVGGTAAGLLAYWDGQAGGFGTTGRGPLLVGLVVVAVVVVVGVVVGVGLPAAVRRVSGRRENRETEEEKTQ